MGEKLERTERPIEEVLESILKQNKNAALHDLKSRLNGASHVFYVAGLSRYLRPTSEQRTS